MSIVFHSSAGEAIGLRVTGLTGKIGMRRAKLFSQVSVWNVIIPIPCQKKKLPVARSSPLLEKGKPKSRGKKVEHCARRSARSTFLCRPFCVSAINEK